MEENPFPDLVQQEQRALESSTEELSDDLQFIYRIEAVLNGLLRANPRIKDDFVVVISMQLVVLIKKEFHLAVLALLRKHSHQAFQHMRNAIEAAGFINAFGNKNDSVWAWIKRPFLGTDDLDFNRLKPKRWEGEDVLKRGYKTASEMSHSNLQRFFHWTTTNSTPDGQQISFSFFDDKPEAKRWLRVYLHWLVGTMIRIMRVIIKIFRGKLQLEDFEQGLNSLEQDHERYKRANENELRLGENIAGM